MSQHFFLKRGGNLEYKCKVGGEVIKAGEPHYRGRGAHPDRFCMKHKPESVVNEPKVEPAYQEPQTQGQTQDKSQTEETVLVCKTVPANQVNVQTGGNGKGQSNGGNGRKTSSRRGGKGQTKNKAQ